VAHIPLASVSPRSTISRCAGHTLLEAQVCHSYPLQDSAHNTPLGTPGMTIHGTSGIENGINGNNAHVRITEISQSLR
jgi:hypothetical protein